MVCVGSGAGGGSWLAAAPAASDGRPGTPRGSAAKGGSVPIAAADWATRRACFASLPAKVFLSPRLVLPPLTGLTPRAVVVTAHRSKPGKPSAKQPRHASPPSPRPVQAPHGSALAPLLLLTFSSSNLRIFESSNAVSESPASAVLQSGPGTRRRYRTLCHKAGMSDATRGLAPSPVNARRLWEGRSIFSRATENGPAFVNALCVQTSTQRSAGPLDTTAKRG